MDFRHQFIKGDGFKLELLRGRFSENSSQSVFALT